MFGRIARFEFRYQVRSPVFWVAAVVLFLLTFAATVSSQLQIGSIGAVYKNSPYAIAYELSVMNVFALVVLVAFVANVIVRDDETGYGPIIRSTRISKFQYLFGRFTGAFAAGALVIIALPLGILVLSLIH